MQRRIELLSEERDGGLVLLSPEVGHFTCALDRGNLVAPGTLVGRILTLGETVELVTPHGVTGRIVSDKPERVHEPVGYGDVLYELVGLEAAALADAEGETHAESGSALTFDSPYTGRFWQRPSPKDPAFVSVGDVIEAGMTIGLIEVMKTFTRLTYEPGSRLPARARVTALRATDGAEVNEGDALLELEGA